MHRDTRAKREADTRQMADEIARLSAHINAATYRLLVLLREFDAANGWCGWKSCAEWLSWRTGLGVEAAREKVRVARALPGLREVSRAFQRGEISYSKVRALTRIATPETEQTLLTIARNGSASQVERVVRGYRRADPQETARENVRHMGRSLTTRTDEHGNLLIRGQLPPELGARFTKALNAAVEAVTKESRQAADPATFPQRMADALVRLTDAALADGASERRTADRHQVVIHVDAAVLADPSQDGRSELETGQHVSAETSRRIACDSTLVTLAEDARGEPLSIGRQRRSVPTALRRALDSRDPGCRFPGCQRTRYLQAHHIRHWASGGKTSLDNLVNLCSFHHRQLHEGGFRIERRAPDGVDEQGTLRFFTDAGIEVTDAPLAPEVGSAEALLEEQADLEIEPADLGTWNGDPLDLVRTISNLLRQQGWRRGTPQET